MKMFTVPS